MKYVKKWEPLTVSVVILETPVSGAGITTKRQIHANQTGDAETVKIIDADAVVRALFDESEKSATSFIGMKKCIQVVKGMDAVTEEDAVSPVREDAVLEALHGLEERDICFIPVYEMINTIEDLKKEVGQ